MTELVFLQVISMAGVTKSFLISHRFTPTSTLTSSWPKCKQMQKGDEEEVG